MKLKIIFSKRFFKDTKKLKKKYHNIDKDLLDFSDKIESGKIIGDKMQNLSGLNVYKARIKNSSIKSGKSGGFRIIYHTEIKNLIYFITIYSKSEQKNINSNEILKILKEENLA